MHRFRQIARRRATRLVPGAVLTGGMLLGSIAGPLGVTVLSPARADAAPQPATMGPGYYLYTEATALRCVAGSRQQIRVDVDIPLFRYRTVSRGTKVQGRFKDVVSEDQGFTSAVRYSDCVHGYWSRRYYGFDKVKRTVTQTWWCHNLGCAYMGTHTGDWRWEGWS